jgi:replicative DNA helicase
MLKEALDFAARGWYVFPCREKPGQPFIRNGEEVIMEEKTPYTAKGLDDASIDPDQINAWWEKWTNAMIGINAGKSGLFVVDIDLKHVDGLAVYSTWNINDSAGLQSTTPSGGTHFVFTGMGKTSTNAKTGIDTRSEGGYFIAPPSKILAGAYPGEYRQFNDWGKTPGTIPDGLMEKLFPEGTTTYVRGNSSLQDGTKKQLSRATLNFFANGAAQGERNSTLFKVVADFAGCGYTREETHDSLAPVCERIKISKSEFEQVLTHAYSKPRSSSIPDSIQAKIDEGGKGLAGKITLEEQSVMEEILLACMMVDSSVIPPVADVLNFEDLQVFKNKVIFKCILKLYNTSTRVDYITVSNEVSKETDKISLSDISKLINQFYVNPDFASTYALIIKEKSSIRKLDAMMSNKDKYMKSGNLVTIVSGLEKDLADIALYGGVKSTTVLDGSQAIDLMIEHNRKMATGEISQLETGFLDYDKHIGGFYSSELIIGAGYSGDGKSALSLSILNHICLSKNKPVAMFTLEMSTRETICRLICQLTGIPFKNVYQAKMTEGQWKLHKKATEQIKDSKFFFDDTFGITVPELRSKIRRLMEKDVKLVVVDQLEQVKGYDGMAPHIAFDKIAYDIKNMTKEFDVPIILNHQLRRPAKDKTQKPIEASMSDLNQAGEKPASQVWLIQHKRDDTKKITQSKIIVAKNRNGQTIEFGVKFLGERMLFGNLSKEESERRVHEIEPMVEDDDNTAPDWAT